MEASRNKTLLIKIKERNEESYGQHHGNMLAVPIVVEPIVVPVPLVAVPVEVKHIAVAIRVAKYCIKRRPCHYPLNSLGAVSYSTSIMPWRIIPSIFIFYLKFLHTPLYFQP